MYKLIENYVTAVNSFRFSILLTPVDVSKHFNWKKKFRENEKTTWFAGAKKAVKYANSRFLHPYSSYVLQHDTLFFNSSEKEDKSYLKLIDISRCILWIS